MSDQKLEADYIQDIESLVMITIEEDGSIMLVSTKTPTKEQIKVLSKILIVSDNHSLFLKFAIALERFVNWLDYTSRIYYLKLVNKFLKRNK